MITSSLTTTQDQTTARAIELADAGMAWELACQQAEQERDEAPTWREALRTADDADVLGQARGVMRVGRHVLIRLDGKRSVVSTHDTECEAIDAYLAAQPIVDEVLS